MREQEFGLQARRINALFGEKFRALLNRFENGHADSLNQNGVIEQEEQQRSFQISRGGFSASPVLTRLLLNDL